MKKFLFLIITWAFMFFSGCSSDNSSQTQPEYTQAPDAVLEFDWTAPDTSVILSPTDTGNAAYSESDFTLANTIVTNFEISPDGKWAIISMDAGGKFPQLAMIVDLVNMKTVQSITGVAPIAGTFVYSPSGLQAYLAAVPTRSGNSVIKVYQISNDAVTHLTDIEGSIYYDIQGTNIIAADPNGKYVYTADSLNFYRIDTTTYDVEEIDLPDTSSSIANGICSVAVNKTGNALWILGSSGGSLWKVDYPADPLNTAISVITQSQLFIDGDAELTGDGLKMYMGGLDPDIFVYDIVSNKFSKKSSTAPGKKDLDYATSIAITPDNKYLYIVNNGHSMAGLAGQGYVAKMNLSDYSVSSKVIEHLLNYSYPTTVAVSPVDGTLYVTWFNNLTHKASLFKYNSDNTTLATNTAGTLDTSFGTAGIIVDHAYICAYDVKLLDDGSVAAAGAEGLHIYNQTGTTVNVFNTPDFKHIMKLAKQADGKLIAIGQDSAYEYIVARYKEDGSVDTGFGTGGTVSVSNFVILSAEVQNDDKIVLAGYRPTGGFSGAYQLMRLKTDGTLDTAFGTGGTVTTTDKNDTGFFDVKISADGHIIASGYYHVPGKSNSGILVCFNSNGSLNTDFAKTGILKISQMITGYNLALTSDNNIIVAGDPVSGDTNVSTIMKFKMTGEIVTAYGDRGMAVIHGFAPYAMALMSNGKLLVGGYDLGSFTYNYTIARLNTNGVLDTTFGSSGISLIQNQGRLYAIALQSDGKIIAAGDSPPYGGNSSAVLMRINN